MWTKFPSFQTCPLGGRPLGARSQGTILLTIAQSILVSGRAGRYPESSRTARLLGMRRRTETGLSVSGSLAGNTPCRGAEHRVFFARVDPLPAGRRDWTGQALNKTISLHLLQQRFSAPRKGAAAGKLRRQPQGAYASLTLCDGGQSFRGPTQLAPPSKHFEARSARDFPQLLFPSQNTERPD